MMFSFTKQIISSSILKKCNSSSILKGGNQDILHLRKIEVVFHLKQALCGTWAAAMDRYFIASISQWVDN